MRISANFAMPLAALFFGLLLVPHAAQAQATNCPKEPTQTSIADGEVYSGANCVLNALGDIDSFSFSANAGDTYRLTLAMTGTLSSNICMALYDPTLKSIAFACTGANGAISVAVTQALTVTGTYQINVSEVTNAAQGYALSLERVFPFPPNAQTITTFGTAVKGDIAESTDSNAFTFTGDTTGTYEVTAALTGSILENICMWVYAPNGTLVSPSMGTNNPGCTGANGATSFVIDFTPAQTGTYMELIQTSAYTGAQTYTIEVSCVVGVCKPAPPPACTMKDAASYNATTDTLTMNFTVGNNVATTWNAWLVSQSTTTPLSGFPISQAKTVPPVPITKTASLSPAGTVGILSTLTTPTKGIFCSSYVQVNTGTP
jgi:hypothetical protein